MPIKPRFSAALGSSLLLLTGAIACRTVRVEKAEGDTTANRASQQSESSDRREESRAIRNLRVRAAHDLDCDEKTIEIRELGRNTQGVTGCGRRATYLLTGPLGDRRWVMNNEMREADAPSAGGQATSSSNGRLSSTQGTDGKTTLTLELPRTEFELMVKFMARPVVYPDRVMLVFERTSKAFRTFMHECDPKIVVDGNLVAAPPSKFKHAHLIESRSIELPMIELRTLASAQRAVADVCGKRIELDPQDLAQVQQFLLRFKEEQALAGIAPAADPSAPRPPQAVGQESL